MLLLSSSAAPVVASLCSLLADADASAQAAALAFSPVKLVLVVGWFYLCLYLVQRVEASDEVPPQFKGLVEFATLILGPLVFLVPALVNRKVMDAAASKGVVGGAVSRAGGIMGQWFRGAAVRRPAPEVPLQLFDSFGNELGELYGHGDNPKEERHILNLTVRIVDDALRQRASDILIDPKDAAAYAVRLRIDGALRTVQELPSETCKAVINSVKAVSKMDIAERRRPQDGAFTAKKGETKVSFRVATAGALNGEKISIRVLNQDAGRFTLRDVGMPLAQQSAITKAVDKPSGTVLVCGPTGSGKTTTLYAMLNGIDRSTRNVITVEDPIEAPLPGISQLEINAKADITFAKTLRSILRQDPDVVCVGEIRDEETAEIALRAAQTGHLVLATIHCDSNATALVRLLDLGVSPLLLSSGLNLLVSQRLIRKLCKECKRPARLSQTVLEEFRKNGVDTSNVSEAAGCEACGGTGYHGRSAICDLLPVTEELRSKIAHDPAIAAKLRSEGEKRGHSNLRNEALRAVVAGVTSFEELKRVVG